MIIKSIEIKNFRSIEYLVFDIEELEDKRCSILLGKNESGKSNILKAIALLGDYEADYNLDCNKSAKKKKESIEINFELGFHHESYKNIIAKKDIPSSLIKITGITKKIQINKDNNIKDYFWVHLDETLKFNDYVIDNNQKITKLSDLYSGKDIITKDNISEYLEGYELLEKLELESKIEKDFDTLFSVNTPKVIFWQPDTQYLIKESVDLNDFKENSNVSIPLRNIFYVSGITKKDIKSRIEAIEEDDEERMELEELLSEEITKYINKVWKEHEINIKVSIESDLRCIVNVEDKDSRAKYKMDQRSDGFKQFISILLNLSAENSTSVLKNKLILLDEPEVHLHPSGIKYLKKELLEIAKNNTLFISTHSPFMVDKLNLSRHYSITKEKAITELYKISKNNPYEEEVIYESLGTSIYEYVSPNMLVFEGKTDKDLFDAFSIKFKIELKIKDIAAISANGATKIPNQIKLFCKEQVTAFVVLDSDKTGKSVKNLIIKENDGFSDNNTFVLTDLIDSNKDMTLEDLLPKVTIEDVLKNKFDMDINLDINEPFVLQIKSKNKTIDIKEVKIQIIESIITDINLKVMTKAKTKEKYSLYFQFIEELYKKIKS